MKKLLLAFIPFMMLCACSGEKTTPEEEVRNYGKYFVEKLAANQLDSLKASYPDIAKADSIVPVLSDTILVVETSPDQYDVTLTEGITMKMNRSEDGNITVSESKGLFAFPADKVDIAKKTGMWDDKLSDAQLNERLKDENFFTYINNRGKKLNSNLITIDKKLHITKEATCNMDDWKGYYNFTNNTDYPIKGSDYTVLISYMFMGGGRTMNGSFTKPGKDIPPHSTIKYPVGSSARERWKVTGVKMKIPQDELVKRFAPFTGKEYQEYLNSKK